MESIDYRNEKVKVINNYTDRIETIDNNLFSTLEYQGFLLF